MKGDSIQQGHLGGYIEGGDPATYYPHLWTWLAMAGYQSVLDVGCGDGVALDEFKKLGMQATGVDGIKQNRDDIIEWDFTKGPFSPRPKRWDLIWSCEFVEHVEELWLCHIVDTFRLGKNVLMTHATPGQAGYHHVNCKSADYWIGALASVGFEYQPDFTRKARELAAMNTSPWNHFARSGLCFTSRWR